MRIIKGNALNFGSYKALDFSFDNLGLAIVTGPTGSGKSTLLDLPPWVLGGKTAKNGSVDEIINWTSESEPTIGTLWVTIGGSNLAITRIRGSSKQNDLFWEENGDIKRGKDLNDTQKLLNERLGVDFAVYCAASYFNEFSEASIFFLASEKQKRQLFERLTSLKFPIELKDKLAKEKISVNALLSSIENELSNIVGQAHQTSNQLLNTHRKAEEWSKNKEVELKKLEIKSKNFSAELQAKIDAIKAKSYRLEAERERELNDLVDKLDALDQIVKPINYFDKKIDEEERRVSSLHNTCETCNQVIKVDNKLEALIAEKNENLKRLEKFTDVCHKIKDLQKFPNPYKDMLENQINHSNAYIGALEAKRSEINPFLQQKIDLETESNRLSDTQEKLENKRKSLVHKHKSLHQLQDLCMQLRALLLENCVKSIEASVNYYLTTYFDAEFKVVFDTSASESLCVEIYKNGHICYFTQLSKGQRQLLKLCFGASIMKLASNNNGQELNLACFDEPCDGLDEPLKIKAYSMFLELLKGYSSILVVDHNSTFQDLFSNRYKVRLNEDQSEIVSE